MLPSFCFLVEHNAAGPVRKPVAFFRLRPPVRLGVILHVERAEHVDEDERVQREQERDHLRVVAPVEQDLRVVHEDDAELDELQGREVPLPPEEGAVAVREEPAADPGADRHHAVVVDVQAADLTVLLPQNEEHRV